MNQADLQYRFAGPDEIADVARLVVHSFPGAPRTVAWWEEQLRAPAYGGGAETLVVGFDDARPAAACQVHALQQWIAGVAMRVAGIGTVSIAPTHRRRGLASGLVTAALRAAHERGDVASALYPFRHAFYHKLGFGQAGEALQYQIAPSSLPDDDERSRVALLDTPALLAEALALYGDWARSQTGQLDRTPALWRSVLDVPDRALIGYRTPEGILEGYALVLYHADLPRGERYLAVDELVHISTAARRALYGWLASMGDQWEYLLIRALPSQRLSDWLREPRLPRGAAPVWGLWAPSATLLTGPMFRLLDVQTAWQQRRINPGAAFVAAFDVVDAQLEHNQRASLLAFADGGVSIESGRTAALTLRMDISTLSRLYIGSLSPFAALTSGLLECDRPDLLPALDTALALPEPWTFDRF